MRDKVSASAVGESPVLEIKVRDTNAADAQAIAQAYAENLVTTAADIESSTSDALDAGQGHDHRPGEPAVAARRSRTRSST